jgi:hypothetical protein
LIVSPTRCPITQPRKTLSIPIPFTPHPLGFLARVRIHLP